MGTQEDELFLEETLQRHKEDFFHAIECTMELLKEFDEMGLNKGAAIGGSLTHLIAHLYLLFQLHRYMHPTGS